MTTATDQDRRARREAVVIEHMQSENVQQWDRTMATFAHARYELPDGSVYDGSTDVMQYWLDGRTLVPDQNNELIELTHLDDGQVHLAARHAGRGTRLVRDPHLRGVHVRRRRPDDRRARVCAAADRRSDRWAGRHRGPPNIGRPFIGRPFAEMTFPVVKPSA